jgi:hypothetical protein
MVSGFRLNFGVSEVGSATVPTILPVYENPKLAGIPLIAGPYFLGPCRSPDIQPDTLNPTPDT